MKFLILVESRADAPALSDPAGANQAARKVIEGALASGQFDCAYQFVTGGGGFAIANADSAEELWAALNSYPLHSQFEWHVKPLVDISFVFDKVLERMKK